MGIPRSLYAHIERQLHNRDYAAVAQASRDVIDLRGDAVSLKSPSLSVCRMPIFPATIVLTLSLWSVNHANVLPNSIRISNTRQATLVNNFCFNADRSFPSDFPNVSFYALFSGRFGRVILPFLGMYAWLYSWPC